MAAFSATFPALAKSDVPVTRHFSPENRKNRQFPTLVDRPDLDHSGPISPSLQQFGTFCDWVGMYQSFPGQNLPVLADGAVIRIDGDGKQESLTLKKVRIEGSHESAVFLRCDGCTVWFDGNVSKLGRPDNVFGYSFMQCLTRINALLLSLGLPPFSPGEKMQVTTPKGWRTHWTGARITRLDLTENFATGSKQNACHFMRFLAMQQANRLKTGTHGDNETVDFGRGSRRVYSKAYLKGPELIRHATGITKKSIITKFSKEPNEYIIKLADWCNSIGLVRFETTYKSTFLISTDNQFLGSIDMQALHADFENRKSVFTRANAEADELSDLDGKLLSIYRMWQAGDDLNSKLKKSQFYHWRKKLLPYGVDIAVKSNIVKFEPKTRIIQLSSVQKPDWYNLPSPSFIRLAA